MSDGKLLGSIVTFMLIGFFSLVWVLACFMPVWTQDIYDPSQHVSPVVAETPQEVMQASKDSNVFIGKNTGYATTGHHNVAIGYHALSGQNKEIMVDDSD